MEWTDKAISEKLAEIMEKVKRCKPSDRYFVLEDYLRSHFPAYNNGMCASTKFNWGALKYDTVKILKATNVPFSVNFPTSPRGGGDQ